MSKYPKPLDPAFVRKLSVHFEALHTGPGRKAKQRRLGEELQANTRTVRLGIYELRQRGVPIAFDEDGYWLATDPAQLDHPIASLTHRLTSIGLTRDALIRARENMIYDRETDPNGQRKLFSSVIND